MREKLKFNETVLVGSLLFGLFFGAGNLIFPVELGQQSGFNGTMAILGFLISGVGLPILGVVASAISSSDSLYEMALPVSRNYAIFFTCLLYLTIGPFFAIPRTATVAFEVGLRVFVKEESIKFWLLVFSTIFFVLTLLFSLKPAKLIDNIGKFMTPLFLILLSILVVFSIVNPMASFGAEVPTEKYTEFPLLVGLVDGYNTMDALASLAFAIIIITNVRALGVKDPKNISKEVLKAGIVCIIGMSLAYIALSYIGSTSLGIMGIGENGGLVLSEVSFYYLGNAGKILLAGIVISACLKTAIGLITACSQMFSEMFPNSLSYNQYAVGFTLLSFLIANQGLSTIISLSIPVLMFSYPLAIVLMLLSIFYSQIKKDTTIYKFTIGFTFIAAIIDFLNALPSGIRNRSMVDGIVSTFSKILPGFSVGFGWLLPALIGFIIGLAVKKSRNS